MVDDVDPPLAGQGSTFRGLPQNRLLSGVNHPGKGGRMGKIFTRYGDGTPVEMSAKELMHHDRTKNYNTLFLLGLLLFVISGAINGSVSFIPPRHVAIIASVLLQAVNGAFWASALAVFYFSCRCKAENFDLELLADAMKADSSESSS